MTARHLLPAGAALGSASATFAVLPKCPACLTSYVVASLGAGVGLGLAVAAAAWVHARLRIRGTTLVKAHRQLDSPILVVIDGDRRT